MMKQTYIKPTIEIIELDSDILMNVTSGEYTGAGVGKGEANDNDPELACRRHGTWGNLWE